MSVPITKRSTDRSGADFFSFSFLCDRCGKEWTSSPVKFEVGGFTGIELDETRQRIWAEEHRLAFEQANLEAHLNFNHCPVCGSRVCDACFNFEEQEHLGVCKECCNKRAKNREQSAMNIKQPLVAV
jgi:hypothetical protein